MSPGMVGIKILLLTIIHLFLALGKSEFLITHLQTDDVNIRDLTLDRVYISLFCVVLLLSCRHMLWMLLFGCDVFCSISWLVVFKLWVGFVT